MTAAPWMPFYHSDYLADTMHLDGPAHGAYFLLLLHYWNNGPLPNDDRILATIARTSRTSWTREIGKVVRSFFELQADGLLHQKRCDIERARAADIISKRQKAGYARHGIQPPDSKGGNGSGGVGGTRRRRSRGKPAKAAANGQHVHKNAPAENQHMQEHCCPTRARARTTTTTEDSMLRMASAGASARPAAPGFAIWQEGAERLMALTGRSKTAAKERIGQLIRDAKEDRGRVLSAILDCPADSPDPDAWISAAVRPPATFRNGFLQLIAEGSAANPVTAFLAHEEEADAVA